MLVIVGFLAILRDARTNRVNVDGAICVWNSLDCINAKRRTVVHDDRRAGLIQAEVDHNPSQVGPNITDTQNVTLLSDVISTGLGVGKLITVLVGKLRVRDVVEHITDLTVRIVLGLNIIDDIDSAGIRIHNT